MKSKIWSAASLRLLILSTLAITFLAACEDDEDRKLAEAEKCVNSATAANVDACIAKVAGMESPDAYLIRCSAHFVAQGFTENRLAGAFSGIKDSNSNNGVTPTTKALSFLVFSNIANHTVAKSKDDCLKSGAASLSRVLQLVELATTFSDAVGGVPLEDPDAMKEAIEDLTNGNTPIDKADVGNKALAIRESFCVSNSAFSSSDVCKKVNAAYTTSGGDATTLGQAILDLLK